MRRFRFMGWLQKEKCTWWKTLFRFGTASRSQLEAPLTQLITHLCHSALQFSVQNSIFVIVKADFVPLKRNLWACKLKVYISCKVYCIDLDTSEIHEFVRHRILFLHIFTFCAFIILRFAPVLFYQCAKSIEMHSNVSNMLKIVFK